MNEEERKEQLRLTIEKERAAIISAVLVEELQFPDFSRSIDETSLKIIRALMKEFIFLPKKIVYKILNDAKSQIEKL